MLTKLLAEKGEFELKYTYPNHLYAAIEGWLAVGCNKDSTYPESRVQSIYLETLGAESYQEKVNSDFFKNKFRVRWYETINGKPFDPSPQIPVFLENKMKIGAKRLKHRWITEIDFHNLKTKGLHSAFHEHWHGMFIEKKQSILPFLQPFIQISYTRKRFFDRASGSRISLDYNIHVEKTNANLLPPPRSVTLSDGVLEIKSKSSSPPPSLVYLTSGLVTKANFSKYERCVSSLEA